MDWRETGQSRLPEPPHMMTGTIGIAITNLVEIEVLQALPH
jgi:hypothetical protein